MGGGWGSGGGCLAPAAGAGCSRRFGAAGAITDQGGDSLTFGTDLLLQFGQDSLGLGGSVRIGGQLVEPVVDRTTDQVGDGVTADLGQYAQAGMLVVLQSDRQCLHDGLPLPEVLA